MANQVISMQQIRSLIQLLERGFSLRAIAAQLHISRQPVTLYANRLKSSQYSFQALRQLNDVDLAAIVYEPAIQKDVGNDARKLDLITRAPYFLEALKRTGVTRLLLWEEYRAKNAAIPTGIQSFVYC